MRSHTSPDTLRLQGSEPFSHEAGSSVGVLVSHGFTAGPASVIHLARSLAEAGFDVECPLLRGHGTRWEDLVGVPAEAWLEDLEAARLKLARRCPTTFVAGLSLGGTLALRLALDQPSLRGVMVINHALWFGNPAVPFAGLLKGLLPSTPAIASDIKDPAVTEPAYDRTPTAGVAELYRLAREVRGRLPELRTPLLIFKSRGDHVLPLRNGPRTLARAGSADKALVWLENSYHVATMDHDKELIAERCLAFVRRLAREQA